MPNGMKFCRRVRHARSVPATLAVVTGAAVPALADSDRDADIIRGPRYNSVESIKNAPAHKVGASGQSDVIFDLGGGYDQGQGFRVALDDPSVVYIVPASNVLPLDRGDVFVILPDVTLADPQDPQGLVLREGQFLRDARGNLTVIDTAALDEIANLIGNAAARRGMVGATSSENLDDSAGSSSFPEIDAGSLRMQAPLVGAVGAGFTPTSAGPVAGAALTPVAAASIIGMTDGDNAADANSVDGGDEPDPVDGGGKPEPVDGGGKPEPDPGDGGGKPDPVDGGGKPEPDPGDGGGKPDPVDGGGKPEPDPGDGDSVYTLPSSSGRNMGWATIRDTGDRDRIEASQPTTRVDAHIDLRVFVGTDTVPKQSHMEGSKGYRIAEGVVIEDARGGDGNDTIIGNAADNELRGRGGNDTIYGGRGNDSIDGGGGNDTVYGGRGNDSIDGGSGDDKIYGGRGNDVLRGGAGADTFIGGAGYDQMYAGNGQDRDVFKFLEPGDSPADSDDTRDQIFEFKLRYDKIDLSRMDADINKDGNQAFRFSDRGAAANSVWFTGGLEDSEGKKYSRVSADVDGNGSADFEIDVYQPWTIKEENIILVGVDRASLSYGEAKMSGGRQWQTNGLNTFYRRKFSYDVNNNGSEDAIFIQPNRGSLGIRNTGELYVMLDGALEGKDDSDISKVLNFHTEINGDNGYVIMGSERGQKLGVAFAAGEFNGDSHADFLISDQTGQTFLLYGVSDEARKDSLSYNSDRDSEAGDSLLLDSDTSANVVIIKSGTGSGTGGRDEKIQSVAFANVDGQDSDEAIISSQGNTYVLPKNSVVQQSGVYTLPAPSDPLSPVEVIENVVVVTSGDFNGDDSDDLVVRRFGDSDDGKLYVLFSQGNYQGDNFDQNLDGLGTAASAENGFVIDGVGGNGFVIQGLGLQDTSGALVSTGDVNRDGIDDIIIDDPSTSKRYAVYGLWNPEDFSPWLEL